MKLPIVIGILLGLALLLSAIALLLQPSDQISYETYVKVDDYVGINLQTDKIYFGTVSPGATGKRDITIGSEKMRYVRLQFEGVTAPWLSAQEMSFSFQGNKDIELQVNIPSGTPYGNYTGSVNIKFYHPLARYLLP